MLPLEEAIHRHLLTGRDTCGPAEHEFLSMPVRLGGLGIIDPRKQASHVFFTSTKLSASLVALIMAQYTCYAVDQNNIRKIKADAKAAKRAIQVQRIEELKENFHPALKRAVDLSTEKRASTWLSVLPIDEYGFCLHKSAFRDALAMPKICMAYQASPSIMCLWKEV